MNLQYSEEYPGLVECYYVYMLYIAYTSSSNTDNQGRIGLAATPSLRAVGPWLDHAFFYELICCETYLNFHQNVL